MHAITCASSGAKTIVAAAALCVPFPPYGWFDLITRRRVARRGAQVSNCCTSIRTLAKNFAVERRLALRPASARCRLVVTDMCTFDTW